MVVFLVYNPIVTPEKQFDIQVDYHFFQRVGDGAEAGTERRRDRIRRRAAGERYFNHTDPQRFNPAMMGAAVRSRRGEPVHGRAGGPARRASRTATTAGDQGDRPAVGKVDVAGRDVHGRVLACVARCCRRRSAWDGLNRVLTAVGRRCSRLLLGSARSCARAGPVRSPSQSVRERPRQHHRHGQRRSRRPAGRRDGLGARRHDGEDRHRRRGGYFDRRAADRRIHLQAHLNGFAGSARATVRVGALRRPCSGSSCAGSIPRRGRRGPGTVRPGRGAADHGRRLRSARRSTLTDSRRRTRPPTRRRPPAHRNRLAAAPHQAQHPQGRGADRHRRRRDDGEIVRRARLFGRAMDSAASLATSLFADLPFSGEVNLLTTGAFAPGDCSPATVPRGVAYLAIGAPTAGGDWSVRAAMSEGDLSSWIVAGAFQSRPGATHTLQFGLTRTAAGLRRRQPGGARRGRPTAAATSASSSRSTRWTVAAALAVEYGGRYARYDYLQRGGLFSPRVGVAVEPLTRHARLARRVAQRMVAPGAEEFLAERNARSVAAARAHVRAARRGRHRAGRIRVERARTRRLAARARVRRTLGRRRAPLLSRTSTISWSRCSGCNMPGGPRIGRPLLRRQRRRRSTPTAGRCGSATRSNTRAQGLDRLQRDPRAVARPRRRRRRSAAGRAGRLSPGDRGSARHHDVGRDRHSRDRDARVRVLQGQHRLRARPTRRRPGPGLDAPLRRPDQSGAAVRARAARAGKCCVGVRNLFRDPNDPASVYDELLVVRPPKRVVGGFLVRF